MRNENSGFYPRAVGVDASGAIFVAGTSAGGFVKVGYSTTGTPLWTNRYLAPITGSVSLGLAVATNGNLVAALGGNDWVTVAYADSGTPLWTNRYGELIGTDIVHALAVDHNATVFVTGSSSDGNGYSDYATIAYSSTGAALWTNRYNGSGNFSDSARSIVVNASGKIFVTGDSSSLRSIDLTTLAYSSEGIPLWTNRYNNYEGSGRNRAAAVALDEIGTVFVAGTSQDLSSHDDYATVAYSSAGEALWTNRYSGSSGGADVATDIAFGASGQVFVTGYSETEYPRTEYATVAYSSAGQGLWTNRYAFSTNDVAQATAVAVDGNGSCFVTGSSFGDYALDYTTIGYSESGEALWTNRYNGPGNENDQAQALAVDGSGRVFVTGRSGGANSYDYATVAYSNSGEPLWTNRYGAPGIGNDSANAIAVDATGNVFVAGSSALSGGPGSEGVTIAYSYSGAALWTNNCGIRATGVATDTNGHIYVVGVSPNNFRLDHQTVAYSNTGAALWTNRFAADDTYGEPATAVAVDPMGNVIVTATGPSYTGATVLVTVAYSSTGDGLWTNHYADTFHADMFAADLAVDKYGNVVVLGNVGGWFASDYAIIKYSSVAPTIAFQSVDNQLVLTWQNSGFALQSAPFATGTFTNIPGALSPWTNNVVEPQRYFRLKAN